MPVPEAVDGNLKAFHTAKIPTLRQRRFNVRRQWVFYSRHDVIARSLALSLHRHIILEFVSPSEPRRWALAFPNPTFKARDIFGRVHILFDGNLSHCFSRARPFSMDRKQSRGKDRNAFGERPSPTQAAPISVRLGVYSYFLHRIEATPMLAADEIGNPFNLETTKPRFKHRLELRLTLIVALPS
ncbi:hypothetical protein CC2G_002025 [Coprinopsis cinerea AmutBmut pab1-1]|nr:hypothetical protein CC2G_002025 [Coprinopsis cinerea AmutBmut pab1-1]